MPLHCISILTNYEAIIFFRVLLVGIRHQGDCLCPHCLVRKWDISKMGQVLNIWSHVSNVHLYVGKKIRDPHDFIFNLGDNVASATVKHLLSAHSWVPTLVGSAHTLMQKIGSPYLKNVLAEKLGRFGLGPYQMLVIDLMHGFELGVWKVVFTHLICILYAAGTSGSLVSKLDKRYMFTISIEKHIWLVSTDSTRFQLLVWIQFGNLPIMPQKWKKLQLEILKTSYRYLFSKPSPFHTNFHTCY